MTRNQIFGIVFFALIVLSYVSVFYLLTRPERKASVEIYFGDRMTEAHYVLIERYNAAHRGTVKVIPIDFPNSDFNTDARKEILARSLRGEDDAIDRLASIFPRMNGNGF